MSFDNNGAWPMTHEERMAEIVRDLPVAFRNYVRGVAYERGHSAGPEEIEGIARGMIADLKSAVAAYNKERWLPFSGYGEAVVGFQAEGQLVRQPGGFVYTQLPDGTIRAMKLEIPK